MPNPFPTEDMPFPTFSSNSHVLLINLSSHPHEFFIWPWYIVNITNLYMEQSP